MNVKTVKLLLALTVLHFIIFRTNAQKCDIEVLKKHVYTLADDKFEGRSIGATGGTQAADYIKEQFNQAGIKPFDQNYNHNFVIRVQHAVTAIGTNIIGVVEGTHPELKNEFIVIGAHYDHVGYTIGKNSKKKTIYNGADDNASGVASVIELGRMFAANANKPDRSIIFVAFDGEETGLNGSSWMLYDSVIDPSKIKLMLSLDMIGMLSKAKGLELLGAGSMKNGEIIVRQIASKNKLPIKKTTKQVYHRTDTKPFGDIGIPAIHFTTGTVSPYHKPEDDADLLDYEGMVNITEFAYNFVLHAAMKENDPLVSTLVNKNGEVKQPVFAPGLRLNIGSGFHRYPDEFYNGKKGLAIQTGLYAQIRMFKGFYLQPEIVYETLASDNANGKIRTHALTAPVNLLVSFASNGDMDVWSYFLLGGYYSYYFMGVHGSKSMDFSSEFSETEHGLNLGYVINISRVQIGFTKKIALSNLYQDKSKGNINTQAFLFNLGLQF